MSEQDDSLWQIENRFLLPEPIGVVPAVRREHQHWQRLGKAELIE